MARIRVKFCGMTRKEDIRHACELGVDAVGMIFVPRSPRAVSIDRAVELCAAISPLTSAVGLFMDPAADDVASVLERVPLNWLQFHGSESPTFCAGFSRPWIKALPMASPEQVQYDQWDAASALLLDAHRAGGMGGSGQRFDWATAVFPERPWILAGGLCPDNISDAIQAAKPPAVDVSSGIEAEPGVKSLEKMNAFMEKVRHG